MRATRRYHTRPRIWRHATGGYPKTSKEKCPYCDRAWLTINRWGINSERHHCGRTDCNYERIVPISQSPPQSPGKATPTDS